MLEGVDKAGKTTQCKKLVQALQQSGRPAEMMRFPGEPCGCLSPQPACGVPLCPCTGVWREYNFALLCFCVLLFPGADRTTTIGQLISAYLEKRSDLEDHTVHLLFSANRWEMV